MKKKVKELYQIAKENYRPLLMSDDLLEHYPVIYERDGSENTANFVQDYLSDHTYFDSYVKFQYGSRVYENDEMASNSIYPKWIEECNSIVMMHMNEWARLYYALSLSYNPLYNVDGIEKEIHNDEVTENDFGIRENNAKGYEVTYDDATEKQVNKNTSHSDAAHDTTTVKAHTITKDRAGNIGVTMTQQLLEAEWNFRRKSFFNEIISTIINESGCDYE